MQSRKASIISVIGALFLFPLAGWGQSSSINTFSPYSLYGIGELSSQGTAGIRSMGGAGVAYRDITPYSSVFNTLNPASYSAVPRRSFLFNFELEGGGSYLKDRNTSSSYNMFNVRDIGILLPLASKIGFGLSVSPYSSVGYRMEELLTDDNIVGNIGSIKLRHEGQGDITQVKAGVGAQLFKNFSLGAEAVYYFGYIDRKQLVEFTSIIGGGGYSNTTSSMSEDVSKIFMNLGFQYNLLVKPKRIVTIGGTYRMSGKLGSSMQHYIPTNDPLGGVLYDITSTSNMRLPDAITFGATFQTPKTSLSADYSFANWGDKNSSLRTDEIKYQNTSAFKMGVQYTPNRFDIRKFMSRITYRMGVRYEQNYLMFNNNKIVDKAVTFGLGIPIKMGSASNINIGAEFGQKGALKNGLIRTNYFKVSIGLSLFGEDYWFMKQKFD